MFKVIRSNIEIAITLPWIARLRSNLVPSFMTSHGHTAYVQGQRSRLWRKVMYYQQKRYNMAVDRFSDFKLGMTS